MEESDVDYHIDEDLEEIFHSDLQNIELGHGDGSHDDIIGDHLPEWLVGVIVVIAMLVVAFFVMVITSLVKNRNKSRSSTYIGTGSSTACDDLESGKIVHNEESGMKITSFTSVPDVGSDRSMLQSAAESSDHDSLTNRDANDATGMGHKNPLFVDDEESDENNDDKENKITSKTGSKSQDINMPSTSIGTSTDSSEQHGKSKCLQHKYKQSCNGKRNSIKSELNVNENCSEHDSDTRKRIFASKSKSGNQTSSKRDKSKGLSSNDVTSSDGEASKSQDDEKECGKEDHVEDQTTRISRDGTDKDSSACCEDSGIELGSMDCHLKDETGGSSESDDLVSMVTRASYDVCMTGNSGQQVDTDRDAKHLNLSPSVTLTSEGESHSSCDTENGFYHTPASQTSSLGCSLENLTLAVMGTSGGKADRDLCLLGNVSRSVEVLGLQGERQEKVVPSEMQKELNIQPTLVTQGLDLGISSCPKSSSDMKRTNEEAVTLLTDKTVVDTVFSAGDREPGNCPSVPASKLLTTLEYDNNVDSDKLLSTNL